MSAAIRERGEPPMTEALRDALQAVRDEASLADLLFLEQWERSPLPGAAAARRIGQIRRANPSLAAAIRAEVTQGRPLTEAERAALPCGPAKPDRLPS
jgi:hypothetical protein